MPLSTYSELRRQLPDRHAPEETVPRTGKIPRTETSDISYTDTTSASVMHVDRGAAAPNDARNAGYVGFEGYTDGGILLLGDELAFAGTEYFDFLDPLFQLQ
jgi:hypothetical protein